MFSQAIAADAVQLLAPISCADTAAATTPCVDVSSYEGNIVVLQHVGVVTAGTIVGKIQTGDASNGSDAADITGAAFASVGTATDVAIAKLVINGNACKKYIRYVGTITTGPAIVGVSILATPKYV
ncbi:MAG: hypothetical protein RLZZ524_2 [Pseudomonadota bacterium]|jgi:hypothetical protein